MTNNCEKCNAILKPVQIHSLEYYVLYAKCLCSKCFCKVIYTRNITVEQVGRTKICQDIVLTRYLDVFEKIVGKRYDEIRYRLSPVLLDRLTVLKRISKYYEKMDENDFDYINFNVSKKQWQDRIKYICDLCEERADDLEERGDLLICESCIEQAAVSAAEKWEGR